MKLRFLCLSGIILAVFFAFLQTHADAGHADVVQSVIDSLRTQGKDLSGSCGAFEIVKNVAWQLKGEGVGLLKVNGGNMCNGYSVDNIAYSDGRLVDILSNAGCDSGSDKQKGAWNDNGTTDGCAYKQCAYTPAVEPSSIDTSHEPEPTACDVQPGTDTSGTTGGDSVVVPPDLTSAGVTALSGKNPSLAFDSVKNLWLIVAENGGKIQGQLMTDKSKPSGSVLNIGGSDAHTPKVAFGAGINKYLVIWTSGKDPSAVLWGQLVSEDGSASGAAFKIGTGGAHLYSPSNIQYDSANQKFVLAYEKAGNSIGVMFVGIAGSGALTGPTKLADVSLKPSNPSIAINTKTQEYCATYQDADKIKIQPISSAGTIGTATELGQGQDNAGIIYSPAESAYTAAWLKDGDIISKTISTCADDSDVDTANLANGVQAGVLTQNTTGFGLFTVNSGGTSDRLTSFDSSGNTIADQTIFAGKWNTDGFWLSAVANISTGMYGAVASPDTKTVKFVSSIGVPPQGPANSGPIAKSKDLPVPSQGLPTDLGQLISAIFIWSLAVIGMVIFVRFFYAGFLWFTAAGSTDKTGRAKNIMINAVYGALVLFSAYVILNTINPDLIHSTFNMAGIPATQQIVVPSSTTTTDKTPTNFCVNNACTNSGLYCTKEINCGGIDPATCINSVCSNNKKPCSTIADCQDNTANTSGGATCTYTFCDVNEVCSTYCDANHTKPCFYNTDCK